MIVMALTINLVQQHHQVVLQVPTHIHHLTVPVRKVVVVQPVRVLHVILLVLVAVQVIRILHQIVVVP